MHLSVGLTEEDCTLACDGMEYCGACTTHAHGPDGPEAWAQGFTHETPEFGDGAQQIVAKRRRAATWLHCLVHEADRAAAFPEYRSHDTSRLLAYVTGSSHERPLVEANLIRPMDQMRSALYKTLCRIDPAQAIQMPEFRAAHGRNNEIARIAAKLRVQFVRICELLPDLQARVDRNPCPVRRADGGRAGRKRRVRARKVWQVKMLIAHIDEAGHDDLMLVYRALGRTPPWWVRPECHILKRVAA